MVSLRLNNDERELIEHLLRKEIGDLKDDEPMRSDPRTLKGQTEYELFLKSILGKVQGKNAG